MKSLMPLCLLVPHLSALLTSDNYHLQSTLTGNISTDGGYSYRYDIILDKNFGDSEPLLAKKRCEMEVTS